MQIVMAMYILICFITYAHKMILWDFLGENILVSSIGRYATLGYTVVYNSQRTTKPTIRSMCPADSDQPVNPSSMARFLVHSSLDSPEAVESTCGQRRLWSDWADGSCKEQQKPRSMRTRKYWSGHIWCAYLIRTIPASILYTSIASLYRPVRVADGPITARYRFIKNAYWDFRILNCKASIVIFKEFRNARVSEWLAYPTLDREVPG